MSDDIINLNEARAVKASDNRLWSPVEMLQAVIRDIQSGEINPKRIVVHYFEQEEPDKGSIYNAYTCGVTYEEHIALLNIALEQIIKDFIV